MQIIIRVSGYLPYFQQRKTKKTNNKTKSRVSPRRRGTFFCFAKRKYPKKGDPQRVEFPPQPSRPRRG
jgi:hypothetical protein